MDIISFINEVADFSVASNTDFRFELEKYFSFSKSISFHFSPAHQYSTNEMLNTSFFVKHIVLWTVKLMKPVFKLVISMLISMLSILLHVHCDRPCFSPCIPVYSQPLSPLSTLSTDSPSAHLPQGSAPSALSLDSHRLHPSQLSPSLVWPAAAGPHLTVLHGKGEDIILSLSLLFSCNSSENMRNLYIKLSRCWLKNSWVKVE